MGKRVVLCLVDGHCVVGVLAGLGGRGGRHVIRLVLPRFVVGLAVYRAEEWQEGWRGRGGGRCGRCRSEEAEMKERKAEREGFEGMK